MDLFVKYIDELLLKSTPEAPLWNIEKIREGKKCTWNYIDGCMIKAVLQMYYLTGDKKYLDFADGFTDFRVHDDGSIDGYNPANLNLDDLNAGKTLFELYDLTKKEKYKKALDNVYSQIAMMPRTVEGSFWHKQIYPNQVWLDGLYMCMPFYLLYEIRFNSSKNLDDIKNQFDLVQKNMLDRRSGLLYHAYDCSREAFWCDRVTGLSNNFWLRALGWYSMALLDSADILMQNGIGDEFFASLKDAFVRLIDAMLKYQDESGMWYQVVNMGGMTEKGNYLETSGSAIFAYAIYKGVRLGILDKSYKIYADKAFNGICDKYLSAENDELHLGGICLVAGLGGKTMRDGTFAYYMSEPIVNDDAKGVAPLLLAYTEKMWFEKN